MEDRKWKKLASEVYCFADDLGKALNDDLTKVQVDEALALVGLDRAAIEPEMEEAGYWVGWAAKATFQKTLGIDPDDSQSPWPPADEDGVSGYARMFTPPPDLMTPEEAVAAVDAQMAQPPGEKTNEELFHAVLPCVTPGDTDPEEEREFQIYSQGCLIELWQRLKKAESPLRLIVSVNGETDPGEEVSVAADRELPITFRALDCDDNEDGGFAKHELPSGQTMHCWMGPVTEAFAAPLYVGRVWDDLETLPDDEATADRRYYGEEQE